MIKAVLLDLDHTLLNNPDETFVSAYLHLIDHHFANRWQHPAPARAVLNAVRTASGPRDMQTTNSDLMLLTLAEELGQPVDAIQDAFGEFYQDAYPLLRDCTESVPIAPALVSYLLAQDYAVVIATNPLYPAEAIEQRLAWAGLPATLETYALVTHAQNMHFTKPDPAYYGEIVARVGVEPDEAIMVGDNPDNDIKPAAQAGLHTFLVNTQTDGFSPTSTDADATGTLNDFYVRITNERWLDTLSTRAPEPTMIEPELRGNVGALFGILAEVKDDDWNQHPDPAEWSILQIVCHLLESEEAVQRPRLQRILAEDNPFLSSPAPPLGPKEAVACDDDGHHAARRFAAARQVTINLLRTIQPEDWYRPARHSIFGPTTLLEMAHFTAQHDRLHLNQLYHTLRHNH